MEGEIRYRSSKQYLLSVAEETSNYFDIDEENLRAKENIKKVLEYASDERLLAEQREILLALAKEYISKGEVKTTSILSKISTLRELGLAGQKPFIEFTKDDISSYFVSLNMRDKPLKKRSIIHKNVHIKHFFCWLYERTGIEYKKSAPDLVAHLSTKVPRKVMHSSELLTRSEVRRMVEACHKKRDKALIMMLYEAGCRARELIGLKIEDLKIETHSFDMCIKQSKTEPRTNTLIESYVYFLDYLNEHPLKHNPRAPLFINVSNGQFSRALLYNGLVSIVNTARKRARINKKVNPHLFRHSRATELASLGWTEAQLRQWFGWSATSNTPTIYVHIGQSDVKKQILRQNGLLNEKESFEEMQERVALQPKKCSRCGKLNPADALTCNCGMALSLASVAEIKKLKEQSDDFMSKLNEMPLRAELIEGKMTSFDYKKQLIQSDPFLKSEFQKIAREVIDKMKVKEQYEDTQEQIRQGVKAFPQDISKEKVSGRFEPQILNMRDKGYPMQIIAEELGIGYGTVNKVCKKHNLTQIY